jgi:hypothetical protein
MLSSWRIWSMKVFRTFILTKFKSDLSTRCWGICDTIWVLSSSTRQRFAATAKLFQAWSLSPSSYLSNVSFFFKGSGTFFVNLLVQNRLNTFLWRWNPSRFFSMYSIVASVWYWYCVIRW